MKASNLELLAFQFFISVVVLSYSWTPIAFFCVPIFLIVSFSVLKLRVLNYVFFLYIVLIALIFYTLSKQNLYIEWARNLLFVPLIIISYILGEWLTLHNDKLRFVVSCFFVSSLTVVLYTFLISVPSDIALFIGDRRGYMAREYLLFGRFYDFSLGVTHLNLYINFCVVIIFVAIINYGVRLRYILGLLCLTMLGIFTQSRSPLLFFIIICCFYFLYSFKCSRDKMQYLIVLFFSLLCLSIVTIPLSLFSDILMSSNRLSSDGVTDLSRFIFFAKGWEHMTLQPWGNSLLYTDATMPLLNYHNTFLSIGNRIAYLAFYIFILLFISCYFYINRICDAKLRFSLLLLLYYCLHNFMIEDVVKFDAFVLFVFLILVSYVRRIVFFRKKV